MSRTVSGAPVDEIRQLSGSQSERNHLTPRDDWPPSPRDVVADQTTRDQFSLSSMRLQPTPLRIRSTHYFVSCSDRVSGTIIRSANSLASCSETRFRREPARDRCRSAFRGVRGGPGQRENVTALIFNRCVNT
jgi:hypothetical protein